MELWHTLCFYVQRHGQCYKLLCGIYVLLVGFCIFGNIQENAIHLTQYNNYQSHGPRLCLIIKAVSQNGT